MPTWFRSARPVMVIAVGLYALYPPFANLLLEDSTPLQVGALLHGSAAVAMIAALVFSPALRRAMVYALSGRNRRRRALLAATAISGTLILANHLLFYFALDLSREYDVTAILVFETWPILFFLLDSMLVRSARRSITWRDLAMVFVTFTGFMLLTAQEIDFTDWMLGGDLLLNVVAFSLAGGVAMTLNTFARRWAMLTFQAAASSAAGEARETAEEAPSPLMCSLVVEVLVRIVASALMIGFLAYSGEGGEPLTLERLALGLAVGAIALAGGSILYDYSIFRAPNASIAVLWYLMPVGSLLVLSLIEARPLTQYEAIAAVLIVSANLMLGLRYTLTSSFTLLYFFLLAAGCWCIYTPGEDFDDYFELVAVATVFYALLGTFALTRQAAERREIDDHALTFEQRLRFAAETTGNPRALSGYAQAVLAGLSGGRTDAGEEASAWKGPLSKEEAGVLAAGDRLGVAVNRRISVGEYVVMTMLAALNVGVILALRGEGLASDIFALTVAAAAAYLLFLIYESDRGARPALPVLLGVETTLEGLAGRIPEAPKRVARAFENRNLGYLASLAVCVFVFIGFSYAIAYKELVDGRRLESAPLALERGVEDREKVVIGAPGWSSGAIKAAVIQEIARRHLAINAEVEPASNRAIFESMGAAQGRIDVHPEVWTRNQRHLIRRYVEARKDVALSPAAIIGTQGLCVNRVAANRGLAVTIADLLDPAIAARFDLDGDGRGEIWLGVDSWASTAIERARADAYGYGALLDPLVFNEPLLLSALGKYDREDQPFLFFCYAPHIYEERFGARRIAEPPHDPTTWPRVLDAATGESDSEEFVQGEVTSAAWPSTEIRVAYASRLIEERPNLVRLLDRFAPSPDTTAAWAYAAIVEGRSAEDIARDWVATNEDVVLDWALP